MAAVATTSTVAMEQDLQAAADKAMRDLPKNLKDKVSSISLEFARRAHDTKPLAIESMRARPITPGIFHHDSRP